MHYAAKKSLKKTNDDFKFCHFQSLHFLHFIYYQTCKICSFFYGFSQSDKTGFSVLVSHIDKVAVFPHKYTLLKN